MRVECKSINRNKNAPTHLQGEKKTLKDNVIYVEVADNKKEGLAHVVKILDAHVSIKINDNTASSNLSEKPHESIRF